MSQKGLNQLIDQAWHHGDLWVRFQEWPDEVVTEYNLTDDEVEALRAGDLPALQEMGVDPDRLDKVKDLRM